MINKRIIVLIGCVLLVIGTFLAPITVFAESETVDKSAILIDSLLAAKMDSAQAQTLQAWIDGELTETAGVGAEWYIIALRQYDDTLDFSGYVKALDKYLKEHNVSNAATRQKYALALVACGYADHEFVVSTLGDSIGEQGIMSLVFGLHLLNNGLASEAVTADTVISELLSLRLEDGGWALSGNRSDVDVTAMAIQALSLYYDDNAQVKTAVDEAVDFLSAAQLENGDFASYGVANAESTAQVIIALSALGIDAVSDSRFIKNSHTLLDAMALYQCDDGMYCHVQGGEAAQMATSQALCAFVARYRTMISRQESLYMFDGIYDGELTVLSENEKSAVGYKLWVCLGVVVATLLCCFFVLRKNRRNYKDCIIISVVGVLVTAFVLLANIQSVDEYYDTQPDGEPEVGTVTITIRCDTVLDKQPAEHIPTDGVMLRETQVGISEGDTVYDVLLKVTKENKLQLDIGGGEESAYVSAIGYLYEFDHGDMSGWIYAVNGKSPGVSCSKYAVEDGDKIEWQYSCEMGNDLDIVKEEMLL